MYADDLVLLAPFVRELQTMINLCCSELTLLDLKINSTKSVAIGIGNRFKVACRKVEINKVHLEWPNEAKYRGIYIESGAKFKCNFSKTKSKFYRVANSILCKLRTCDNASVTMSLMSSVALSILMYAVASLALNKSELNLLDHHLC